MLKEVKIDTLDLIINLINSINPEKIPRGMENFKLMSKINDAFEKAKGKEYLFLDSEEYNFIKTNAISTIPSIWANNKEIYKAVLAFDEAAEFDPNAEKSKEKK